MIGDQTFLTPEGLEKLQTELRSLKYVRRKEIAEKIERAKELGDLSENAEYQEAKEEQAFAEGRIIELEAVVNSATVISGSGGAKHVGIGNVVRLRHDGDEREYTIVGVNEADPVHGKISNESPIGRALIGKCVGDEVEVKVPKGTVTWNIVTIS